MAIDNRQLSVGGAADFRKGNDAADALGLMGRALALLDATEVPADVGAYLDHAIHKLRDWTDSAASNLPTQRGTVWK